MIAHDRRGHGRSTETYHGNEMDTYAADNEPVAAHAGDIGTDIRRLMALLCMTRATQWKEAL